MQIEDISCKKCGASLNASVLSSNRNIVECPSCKSVFTLKTKLTGTLEDEDSNIIIPMPDGLSYTDNGVLRIVYEWRNLGFIALLVFGIIWSAIVIGIFWGMIKSGFGIGIVMAIPFTLIGLGLIYFSLTRLVNKTNINVSDTMVIKHRPLPWPGNKTYKSEDIIQLFCKQKVHRSKNGENYTYELHAVLQNHKRVKIIGMFQEAEQAIFIEKKIEKHLNIADLAVAEEFKR